MVLLSIAYLFLWHGQLSRKIIPFILAMLLFVIALFSPLQLLSASYLFSVHMAVHVLLLLIIAPLLVFSLPAYLPSQLQRFFNFLSDRPALSWFVGVGIMWFWHVPAIFNSMTLHHHAAHMFIHHLETLSLLISGIIFSYPIVRQSLPVLNSIAYLFTACVFCSLLGLMITFAPSGIYLHYLSSADPYHLNDIIQNQWQISQVDDQQAAGLIMWVPCCMIYLAASIYLLKQWFDDKAFRNTIKTFTKRSRL